MWKNKFLRAFWTPNLSYLMWKWGRNHQGLILSLPQSWLHQVIWTSSKGSELAGRKMYLVMTPMVEMRSIVNENPRNLQWRWLAGPGVLNMNLTQTLFDLVFSTFVCTSVRTTYILPPIFRSFNDSEAMFENACEMPFQVRRCQSNWGFRRSVRYAILSQTVLKKFKALGGQYWLLLTFAPRQEAMPGSIDLVFPSTAYRVSSHLSGSFKSKRE